MALESTWLDTVAYDKGDIVNYGGYSYIALQPALHKHPHNTCILGHTRTMVSVQGQLGQHCLHYYTGDVVKNNGYTYWAALDNTGTRPQW